MRPGLFKDEMGWGWDGDGSKFPAVDVEVGCPALWGSSHLLIASPLLLKVPAVTRPSLTPTWGENTHFLERIEADGGQIGTRMMTQGSVCEISVFSSYSCMLSVWIYISSLMLKIINSLLFGLWHQYGAQLIRHVFYQVLKEALTSQCSWRVPQERLSFKMPPGG